MITDEALIRELREILGSHQSFPIDLDDVSRWLVYKLRQRLVTILTSKFTLNVHYTERRLDHCVSFKDKDFKKYYISIECFEKFCKFRKGSRGRKVHTMLLDLKREEFSNNEEENTVGDGVDESEWSSSPSSSSESGCESGDERDEEDDDEVPSNPPISSPSSSAKDITAPSSMISDDKYNCHDQDGEEDGMEDECKSHKRHLDELEEVWTRQNAKMQRVLDKMDARTPLEEFYWFSPHPSTSTSTNATSNNISQSVPDYLQSFSDDDSEQEHEQEYEDEDVLRLLNL